MRGSIIVVTFLAAGCTFSEAHHTPLPHVVEFGGPVLASPKWAVITFPSDPLASDIDQFVTRLATSSHWKTVVSEYGVGSAAVMTVPVTDAAPATITDQGIQAYLTAHLSPLASGWPALDTSTVYVVYYPDSTTVTNTCTNGVAGYHSSFELSGTPVAYAVIPRCDVFGEDPLTEITEVSSHELAESATDPDIASAPAYLLASDYAWQAMAGGGEIADLCQVNPGSFVFEPELGYWVQRIWSNDEAAAGHDPCVPHPDGDTYFQAAPDGEQTVTLSFSGSTSLTSPGLLIPIHTTKTIGVELFSDGPTAPINVSALEIPIDAADEQPADLALSFDKTSGTNGDTVHLTIAVNSDNYGEGHQYFVIMSQVGDLQVQWPVVVQN